MQLIGAREKKDILHELSSGKSQNSVARSFGHSPSTVNRIAKEAGLEYSGPKNANSARRTYAKAARLELSDRLFEKIEGLIKLCDDPRQLRELATVFGILVDKRLLEEGKATQRLEERVIGSGARAKLAALLDSSN